MNKMWRVLLVAVIISVLASVASADGSKFKGKLSGHAGDYVEIERPSDGEKWDGYVKSDGSFEAENKYESGDGGHYKFRVKNWVSHEIDEKDFSSEDWKDEDHDGIKECHWTPPPAGIPEFPTVALPIAAVIGMVFLFQNRKKKE